MFYDPWFTQNIVDSIFGPFFLKFTIHFLQKSYFIVGLLQRKSPMNKHFCNKWNVRFISRYFSEQNAL